MNHPRPPMLPPSQHRSWCTEATYEWHEQILPGLPCRGRCRNCDAVTIERPRVTT